MNTSTHSARTDRAFTLTDLLVLIAVLALLAMVTVPALAGIQNKGGRLECANNLRQIGMESMVYAGESSGWLPIVTLGAANGIGATRNHLANVFYTRFLYFSGPANTPIPTNGIPGYYPTQGRGFQNLGYLYEAGLAGNGKIFYCPAYWGDPLLGANAYSPLLTTDSSGDIRSSYFYNPRIVNAFPPNANELRRYQTTSQLEPHRLFAVDAITAGTASSSIGINPASMQHIRDRGWNVLFTDGSVQFSRLTKNNNYFYNLITQNLQGAEGTASDEGYDQTYNFLEQDH